MRKLSIIAFFLIITTVFAGKSPIKEPGDISDDFTLKSPDQAIYNLNEVLNSGNTVVVMFWSTKCPYVQAYHSRAKELYSMYHDKGITFWAVNSNYNESLLEMEEHAKENSYPFPVLKDENNLVADMLGAQRTPEVYVIGKGRQILYHGRIDNSKEASEVTSTDLKYALNEITEGKEVTVKITKYFGCTIKRQGQD